MPLATNIWRRKSRYYYRARVPTDLIARVGRREVSRSLTTADPETARRKVPVVSALLDRVWGIVRNKHMKQPEIDELLRQWLREKLDEDRTSRLRPWHIDALDERNDVLAESQQTDVDGDPIGPLPQYRWEADEAADEREEWESRLKSLRLETASFDVNELLQKTGIKLDPSSTEYHLLCQGICRGMVEFWRIAKARAEGDWADKVRDPLFRIADGNSAIVSPNTVAQPKLSQVPLADLLERCLAERRVSEKTQHDYRTALRALIDVMGKEKPLGEVEKKDLLALKDTLTQTPANWSKHFPGKSLKDIIQLNKKRGLPTLAAKTINMKYLTCLRSFFQWAQVNDHMTMNPAQGIRVEVSKRDKAKRKRLPFTDEQLVKMFKTPLFTSCRSNTRIFNPGETQIRDHRFWAPLLALFTGARANELGQLEVADFRMIDGIHCIDLRESADEGRSEKRLKSRAAHRLVPLHPELSRLGFSEYLAELRETTSRIFPKWQLGSDGYYSSTLSKFFARFCDQCVSSDARLTFHSFRHCFVDALRRAGVPEDMRLAIVGHEPNERTHSGYGDGFDAPTLYAGIAKVSYPGLDLGLLYAGERK